MSATASDSSVTGILLAGGRSRRMGREKGLLPVGSGSLYQYPLKALEKVCSRVLISSCSDLPFPEDHPVVCDEFPGVGPIGGISTCLKRSSTDLNLVLSYDTPLVNAGLLTHLLDQYDDEDVLVPTLDSVHIEPLCALYHKRAGLLLEARIRLGRYALYEAFDGLRTRKVRIDPSLDFYRPDLFLNINRVSDLDHLPNDLT